MVVRWDGAPNPPDTLTRITQAAPHRNPPTHHTHQHLTITAHARIDNRHELLPQLQDHLTHPHPTDTQLILAAHQHWGPQTPQHLIGDYAYAIHDTKEHTLHAARDPMGMRPLYYHHTPQRTAITSEIQQILALGDVEPQLFEPMIAAYLCGQFGPDDWTFFRGVHRLPPGHRLEVDANGARTHRFWQPDPHHEIHYPHEDDYAHHLRELFLQAVRDRLQPPGPHGLLLSGGVDSGSIAAAAGWAWRHGEVEAPVRAYSWAFEELVEHDERAVSSLITRPYGLPEIAIPADDAWPLAGFPAHGPAPDDPFLDPIQPLLDRSLQTAASDGVRTLISGDRGDPVAGDIEFDYRGALRARRWGRVASELRSDARSSHASLARTAARRLIVPALQRAGLRPPKQHDPARLMPAFLSADLVRRSGVREVIAADLARRHGSGSVGEIRAGWITTFKGRLDPIPQERRRAMHGLAFADPWADLRLVEFMLATPAWHLQRAGTSKHLVRTAMRPLAPNAVDRWGHGSQQGLFERGVRDKARATVLELVERPRLVALGLVDEEAFRVSAHGFVDGRHQHFTFWLALSLEIWLREYAT